MGDSREHATTGRRGFGRLMAAALAGTVLAGSQELPGSGFGPFVDIADHGGRGDGVTNDSPALQAAINSLGRRGGTIVFSPGTYLCTSDVVYNVDSRAADGGVIGLVGAGRNASTIVFQGADLVDGEFADWNAGFTELYVEHLALRFVGKNGKGFWKGATTLPMLTHVTLGISGTYDDNSIVLLGRSPGPVGVTALFADVVYEPKWSAGDYVTGLSLHFDSFHWQGGAIITGFPESLADPRLLWLQPVFFAKLESIVPYVPERDAVKTFALVSLSEPSGCVVVERCGWYRTSWSAFFRGSSGNPSIYVYNCSLTDNPWPLAVEGRIQMHYRDNPGFQ